uniref:Dirigent protein n=1 Tax=Opuntia streptacantha TaxID=393608 RepID=A0A7C9DQ26_OPUST
MAKHEVAKLMIFAALVLCPTWASPQKTRSRASWAETVSSANNERTTNLQFYFHDIVSGNSPTAVPVARASRSNGFPTGFGTLVMADDPLTEGPDPKSKLVGRAQGLYGSASLDEVGLLMVMSYTFTDGEYEGSSLSILGRNSAMHPVREMAVVGGTGVFRMARGYAQARTYWYNPKAGDAIVGYNVTVVH